MLARERCPLRAVTGVLLDTSGEPDLSSAIKGGTDPLPLPLRLDTLVVDVSGALRSAAVRASAAEPVSIAGRCCGRMGNTGVGVGFAWVGRLGGGGCTGEVGAAPCCARYAYAAPCGSVYCSVSASAGASGGVVCAAAWASDEADSSPACVSLAQASCNSLPWPLASSLANLSSSTTSCTSGSERRLRVRASQAINPATAARSTTPPTWRQNIP